MEEFKAIEHGAGSDVPEARAPLQTTTLRIGIDELVQAERHLLNTTKTPIGMAVEKEDRSKPVPADPGVPVIHRLNLPLGNSDPRKIVTRLASRKAHPHKVL